MIPGSFPGERGLLLMCFNEIKKDDLMKKCAWNLHQNRPAVSVKIIYFPANSSSPYKVFCVLKPLITKSIKEPLNLGKT